MSVGRTGCIRENFLKPYTWQEISKGYLEHQLSNLTNIFWVAFKNFIFWVPLFYLFLNFTF